MTMPIERTRAVINAQKFLIRLSSPYNGGIKGVKREVREEARRILRHYPGIYHLKVVSEQCDGVFDVTELGRESDGSVD